MACPAYGSTSNMALYYCVDPDPALSIGTPTWLPVPITSESLAANLTSSISERITDTRSYANSVVTQGEISGSFGFEAEASTFMDTMLQAALQSSTALSAGAITNGKAPMCLAFMKAVKTTTGYDYFIFRGCQIDSMSLSVSPGSFITGEIGIMGQRMGAAALTGTAAQNGVLQTAPGTIGTATSGNLMSSVFALQGFEVLKDSTDVGVIIQELTVNFSNQLRQQFAVGTGTPYAAGVASGRFQCTLTGNAYYSGPEIIDAMLADSELAVNFDIFDAEDAGWSFSFPMVKVTSAPPPAASGPDQDIMSQTEFQCFQSATGSVIITKSA